MIDIMEIQDVFKKKWKSLGITVDEDFWNEFDMFCREYDLKKGRFTILALKDAMKKYKKEFRKG